VAVEPFIADPDFTLYVGDALTVLAELPDESVDCVVTSPPYWGLRDYGVEGQIGLETTPAAFVEALVGVFREMRRVLADHGTVWVNLGDSYNNRSATRTSSHQAGLGFESEELSKTWARMTKDGHTRSSLNDGVLKEKDLVGIPWRVAFALQDDGWYLRSDIIWAKPNPMPESVTDRPTKSHEYIFLLSKRPSYFFDQEAVREPWTSGRDDMREKGLRTGAVYLEQKGTVSNHVSPTLDGSEGEAPLGPDGRRVTTVKGADGSIQHRDGERWPNSGRNIRTVWEIATQPYSEPHFATFPEELPRRAILAGCPEWVCRSCGKPRERIVEKPGGSFHDHADDDRQGQSQDGAQHKRKYLENLRKPRGTVGWSDCGHGDYRAGVVLDPFMGSGTTALVARKLNRHAIGIELSPGYADLCARRLQQLSLLA
jgi:DNA modification methylase